MVPFSIAIRVPFQMLDATVFTIETNAAKTVYNPLFLVGKTTITQLNH